MGQPCNHETQSTFELRLWSLADAQSATPYVRRVVGSLREHWLELRRLRVQVRRLEELDGPATRQKLIARSEAGHALQLAERKFEETFKELSDVDVFCLDPACGLALLPFWVAEELAWYVFDLFSPAGLDGWRFHTDGLETRRPMTALAKLPSFQ